MDDVETHKAPPSKKRKVSTSKQPDTVMVRSGSGISSTLQSQRQPPPPQSVKLNPMLPPALLGKPPADLIAKQEKILEHVRAWESAAHNVSAFEKDFRKMIEDHYFPVSTTAERTQQQQRLFIDEVLAAFLLFHPEYTSIVINTLEFLLVSGMRYSKASPPFTTLLNLFASDNLYEEVEGLQYVLGSLCKHSLVQNHHSVHSEMLLLLGKSCLKREGTLAFRFLLTIRQPCPSFLAFGLSS